ncbi:site-specific integrase [Burkholderia sp. B21-005]|uniref:site-specific integrase n=1 Tax=Burkholderia sp. B21-005 TaxID=2890406 RepID=UPI001E50FEB3|nr:site-specific integrase [Burkholderia sp. B21-005]UEP39977.1 site-specific integrase [Burkholderia sp. B21-005]
MEHIIKLPSGRFQARISYSDGKVKTRSFATLEEAEQWLQGHLPDGKMLSVSNAIKHASKVAIPVVQPPSPLRDLTLREALEKYAQEVTPLKKSARTELGILGRWLKNPLADRPLYSIRGADLTAYMNQRLARGIAIATIRTEIALISHLYEVARTDWGYESLLNPRKAMRRIKQGNVRDRRLRPGEFDKIMAWCDRNGDQWLKVAVIVAVETAMRSGEIASLTWPNINLDCQLAYLPDTKNGTPRMVPLSRAAVAALRTLPVNSDRYVFDILKGSIARRFKLARIACDMEDFKFHDLRHEAVSRLFEKGFNMMEAAAISGHKTLQMLKRYTHLDPRSLLVRLG